MASTFGRFSIPATAGGNASDARVTETPKDLKKRVRSLDKSLASVHERLIQTEKQIFDLERSYFEETRLYGNVLHGWDAYFDTKKKGKGKGEAAGGDKGNKREASDEEDSCETTTYLPREGGPNKRIKGVELEERLFSLGSVTSPAAKGLQKLEEAKRKAGSKNDGGGGSGGGGDSASGAAGGASAGPAPKTPKEKRTYTKRTVTKSSKKESAKKKR